MNSLWTSVGGTLGATDASNPVTLFPRGLPVVGVEITGTFVQNLIVEEVIADSGWVTAQVFTAANVSASASPSAPVRLFVQAAGRTAIRVRQTAYTSGTATVVLTAGFGAIGSAGGGGGGASTIADGADVALGTTTDAGIITDVAGTGIGFLRGAIKMWITYLSRFPAALGGTTSAASLPVVLSSDGPFAVQTGSITETAPATDTASSGLNGRLQRVAQRLSSLIALLPAALVNGGFVTTGDVAHGTADAGNPMKHGATAIAHGTNPTAVAAAARTTTYANRAGVPFVIGGHPNVQTIGFNFATAQTDTAIVTVASGLKIVVTGFLITASNANTVNVSARLGFGLVNTPAYSAAGLIGTHPNIAPGSGFGRGGGSGIIGVGADDQDLRLTCSVPTGGSVDCMVSYYTVES